MTMLSPIAQFFEKQDEPHKSCFLALRQVILNYSPEITEEWKYSLPFYYFRKKMFCYLWNHKKFKKPYIGIVESRLSNHPALLLEDRARMKIFVIDPNEDIPMEDLYAIFDEVKTSPLYSPKA